MKTVDKIHDSFFKKVFSDLSNVKTFLEVAMPEALRREVDFQEMSLDPASYVSDEYKESFSDIVVKTRTTDEKAPVDVYLLFEHKSYPDHKIFIQLLKYMYLMWKKDSDEAKPLRAIIPLVFYHGKKAWKIPTRFEKQFAVKGELKKFLLKFQYLLFDTSRWDWEEEKNKPLREDVFLLTSLLLMKSAYREDIDAIRRVLEFWSEKGFIKEREQVLFFLIYITQTQDISQENLAALLETSQIKGGEVMPTLAERWVKEGIQKGRQEGRQEGYILGIQEVLITLLSARFKLEEEERQFIRTIQDSEKLNAALKGILTARSKEEVLQFLRTP